MNCHWRRRHWPVKCRQGFFNNVDNQVFERMNYKDIFVQLGNIEKFQKNYFFASPREYVDVERGCAVTNVTKILRAYI